NVYHYDTSMQINRGKSAAIMNTGADAVVTGCPGCMMQLSDGLKQCGAGTKVMHTLEFLARSIR
ncbi:MAG TPA: (Fe-S)-binding protein, partial [Geobacteraceae bacterium]